MTKVFVLEQTAQQQAADLLHRVLRREGDGRRQVALPAVPLDLTQEVLHIVILRVIVSDGLQERL